MWMFFIHLIARADYMWTIFFIFFLIEADLQQKKEPAQEDSDLDRKRRETEALLQSIGISPEPPLGI